MTVQKVMYCQSPFYFQPYCSGWTETNVDQSSNLERVKAEEGVLDISIIDNERRQRITRQNYSIRSECGFLIILIIN